MSYPMTEPIGRPLESGMSKSSAGENELPRRLRRFLLCFQILTCIITSIQLTISLIAPCVFFSKMRPNLELSSITVAVLTSNAFTAVCGGLGLVAAIGRSPVLLAMSLIASTIAGVMASILINTMSFQCHFTYGTVECGRYGSTSYQIFSTLNYAAMLLNEGGILTFSFLTVIATAFLLCMTYMKWQWIQSTRA